MPPDDHGVYDKDDEKPASQRGHDSSGGGQSSDEPRTIHKKPTDGSGGDTRSGEDLRGKEESAESFYHPNADEARERNVAGAHESLSELAGGSKSGGGFYNPKDEGPKVMKAVKNTLRQRRKVIAGGGAAAGAGTIVIAGFFLLVPLKIEHVVTNLEKRFFASANDAVEQQTQNMFERYMVKHVLPSYKDCGTTISKACTAKIDGTGPVSHLYRTWANARIENKLATNFDIEFKYDKTSKRWFLKAPGTNVGGDDIGPDGHGLSTDFKRANRAEMRAAVNKGIEHETRWKKVMYRYKVGRLLEEKYGIKRCIMFCGTRDQLADKKDAKVKAYQLKLVQRVVTPRTESLGIVLECMLQGCDPTKTEPISADDGKTAALHGSPENPETDTAVREANQRLAAAFASASADSLLSDYKDISDKGFSGYMLEKVLTKVGLGAIASQAADAVPIVGWVIAASHVIHFANNAGPAVQKLGYIVNSSSYVQSWQMSRTYADEIHTGHADATEVGSFTDALSPGDRGTPSDPQVGGTAGAEQTRLYRYLIGNESPGGASTVFNGLLPGKAYAASNGDAEKCNNGGPIPGVALVCPEFVLGQSIGALDAAHTFLNLPVIGQITYVADQVSGIVGAIGSIIGSIITHIPGLGSAIQTAADFISQVLQPFFTAAINVLIPSPVSTAMSGGRVFDLMAGGADVAGNLFAQIGVGGQVLTAQQSADIINHQQTQERQLFDRKSVFARMFDTDSQYSLVSQVALQVPFGTQATVRSGVASLLDPLGAFGRGFGSILGGRVNAAVTARDDPFGITQYGYPPGSIPEDPEAYWENHCSDNASYAYRKDNKWNEEASKNVDPKTGMPTNKTTNPCLLIKASIGAVGGYYDTSNLTADDLANQPSGSSGGSQVTGPVSGDAQELARQILNNDDISKVGRYVTEELQNTADGKPAYSNVNIALNILQFLAELGETTPYAITSITGAGSGHSSGSNHYSGKAVDLGCPLDERKSDEVAQKYNLLAQNERCENTPGNEHMHYSKDGY